MCEATTKSIRYVCCSVAFFSLSRNLITILMSLWLHTGVVDWFHFSRALSSVFFALLVRMRLCVCFGYLSERTFVDLITGSNASSCYIVIMVRAVFMCCRLICDCIAYLYAGIHWLVFDAMVFLQLIQISVGTA